MLIRTPPERIVRTEIIATSFNREHLGKDMTRRIVELACGHLAITCNQKTMICIRCTEMLRRSITSGEEDYESFRHGDRRDLMEWPDDPCRLFNEPHSECTT